MDNGAISAETIGNAALYDPQLRIPLRPRRRRGLVIDIEVDQVLVEGTPKRQIFRGRSATEMLPALIDRLDGRQTHADLAEALEISERHVFKAVSLLWACGVIEEATPSGQPELVIEDRLADFLSRIGDSTGANDTWEESAGRLAVERVEVFGDGALARQVIGELEAPLNAVVARGAAPAPETSLVLMVGDGNAADTADLTSWCWEHEVPLVRLQLTGRTAELGPYVHPVMTPCLECLLSSGEGDDRAEQDADSALAAALFARDVFAMISRSTPTPLPMRWRQIDLESLASVEIAGASRPGCPRCSVSSGPVADHAGLAARFEAGVAMPPKAFVDVKAHQKHYKPSNIALQRRFRTWPVAPRTFLPVPPLEWLGSDPLAAGQPSASPFSQPMDARWLSLILTVTAGIQGVTNEAVMRWTASGGNIGSVTAYVVVRDCFDVPSGIYAYVDSDHALARLSSDTDAVPGASPVTLVLTGNYVKVAQKYSAFGLRIVLLDSGCAQAAARAAAVAIGLPLVLRPDWDDTVIAAVLGIDPDLEPITAVIDLGDTS